MIASLEPRLSSSFSLLAVRKIFRTASDEKLDESLGSRLGDCPNAHTSCRIYAHYCIYAHDSIYAHLEYRITLMHAVLVLYRHGYFVEQSERRREALKTARTREGPHYAFQTAAEKETRFVETPELCSHCYSFTKMSECPRHARA